MIWITLCIFLILIVGVLAYLVYVNNKKVDRAIQYCEAYVRFIGALYFRFQETRDRMKEIDRLGAFQADDEVGVIFKELDGLIDDLHMFINEYVNAEEKTEEAKN